MRFHVLRESVILVSVKFDVIGQYVIPRADRRPGEAGREIPTFPLQFIIVSLDLVDPMALVYLLL